MGYTLEQMNGWTSLLKITYFIHYFHATHNFFYAFAGYRLIVLLII